MNSYNHFKNFLWYLIPFGFKNFLPLIALPVFTRHISVEEFGLYALAVFYGTFGAGIANLGLSSVFERNFFEKTPLERKKLLWNILCFVFLLFLVISFLTVRFNSFISIAIFQSSMLTNFLFVALFFQTFKSLNLYFFIYLKNYENAQKYTYLSILESILSIGIAMGLVVYFSMGLYGFLIGQAIGVFITFILAFFSVFFPFKHKLDIQLLKDQLNLSLPLTPRIFFGVINSQFDRYMLGILSSMGGVGLFDIGQKIANTSFTFMTTVQNVFAPQVYKRLFSKDLVVQRSVGTFLTPFFYLCILYCLTLALFSYEIIYILTPEEFHKAAPVVSILCLLYGFYFFGKQPQLLFAKKTGLISAISLISVFLNIGLNFLFIKYFGVVGAAFATLLAGSISTAISFYFGQKYTPIQYEKSLFIILLYFVTVVLAHLLFDYLGFDNLFLILFKIFSLLFYLILGRLLRIISISKIKVLLKSI